MRDVESGETPFQLRLIRILQAGEAAQPGHVVIGLGRVIDRFRPGVGHQELQAVRVPLLGEQLQPVINGIGDELRFRGNPGELRIRKQQLRVLNLSGWTECCWDR